MRRLDAREQVLLIAVLKNAACNGEGRLVALGLPVDELWEVSNDAERLDALKDAAREEERRAATFEPGDPIRRPGREAGQDAFVFRVALEQSDDVGWYSLAGALHGPFLSPERAAEDLGVRVQQWGYGAVKLGGAAWLAGPLEVVVSLPHTIAASTGDVIHLVTR